MKNFWKDKTVVVTGADGFIGSHLIEYLVDYSAHVRAWVRKNDVKNIRKNIL